MLRNFAWLFSVFLVAFPGGFVLVVFDSLAWAEAKTDAFVITSDRLEMDEQKHIAVFLGRVHAKEKKMELTAEKMTVRYHTSKKRAGSGQNILRKRGGVNQVIAEGRVILVQGESRGSAEEMIYRVKERTLEMLGRKKDASIHHGQDRLQGRKILLTLGPDQSIVKVSVQGDRRRRVSAHITPSEEEDGRATAEEPRGLSRARQWTASPATDRP